MSFVIWAGIPNSSSCFPDCQSCYCVAFSNKCYILVYIMANWTRPIAQWWCGGCLYDLCSYGLVGIPFVS